VSYLGYPNTAGLSTIDYRLTDAWADPPGTTERYHTEELVRLPNGFICYQPSEGMPAVSDLPALERGYLTFGSFNNLAKVTPDVVAVWARLLRAVPESRLILKSRLFEERWVCEHFLDQFIKSGVEEERVQLHGFLPRHDHFSLYRDIDIALDTFPYNGTTTMCESLWMGVPNITLAGQMHAGRVGVSILQQVGLTEWIAASADKYVGVAVYWSKHVGALSELRMSLRNQMAQSDLCDAPGFVRDLEGLYRNMWKTYLGKNH
jgi:predicted O-linked N-acetylglucosamine transferase (SPINDLY family)